MTELTFHVPGKPVGKGRPRFTKYGRVYTPAATKIYEQTVRRCFCEAVTQHALYVPQNETVNVIINVYMPIPASDSKKLKAAKRAGIVHPYSKPDVDNIAKVVLDALNGLAYDDDRFINKLVVKRFFREDPTIHVTVQWGYNP